MALENDNELKEIIRKAALLNAVQHGGKAQVGPVTGKILGGKAELRAKPNELTAVVNGVVEEFNRLSAE